MYQRNSRKEEGEDHSGFLVLEVFKSRVVLPIPILEELAPPRETDRESTLCGSPVEARHVCGLWSILSLFLIIGGAAWSLVGLVLILEIGSSSYAQIYDLCGGMVSYMQIIFYIHVKIPVYGFVY